MRLWAAAAAAGGLALAILFLASAVGGAIAPGTGTSFLPGAVRTDLSVKTTVAALLKAGAFIGLGAGVYLAIGGLLALFLGALLQRSGAGAERAAWRTQDYVLVAVLAVVFGAVYWAWLQPYLWIGPIAAQPGAELFFSVWFVGGLLAGYVIRKPGAAFLAETLGAACEVLLGAPAGPILVVTGMMQALGAELVFAATGYRRWGMGTLLVAGAVTAIVALPWNWFRLGYFALSPDFLVLLFGVRVLSGALAGFAAKVLGDVLAATGSLNQFALGRERMREV
ncbi:MAG: ECF transporter S component [Deltaproteobacteria bacterium]|nr:ECF transporter S component [Deltaproteobacteria bacterium]